MDLSTVLGAAGTVLGALIGWVGAQAKERRVMRREAQSALTAERTAEQAHQTAAISERDALIRTITETLVDPLRQEVRELRTRLDETERKVDGLEERNDRLVAFIYKLAGIIRRGNLEHEILPADIPPEIHL